MIAAHFREYWLFGLLFAIVAPLQLAWAGLVRGRPTDRGLLAAGAAGSAAVASVWIVSRTFGLPIGTHPWEAEAVGVKDLIATVEELLCALIVVLVLTRRAPGWPVPAAWALAGIGLVAAILPGGHA